MATSSPYTILIAGFGALGTVFGTFLKKAGHTVFALTKTKYLPALKDRRVRVSGIWGDHEAVLDGVYASVAPLVGSNIDLIIFTVKSYDTRAAIEQVKPLVGGDTLVIVAQNGYGNYETVSTVVGREHTLLARIIFGAKMKDPGRAEVTVIADANRMGQPHNAVDPGRIRRIADAIKSAGVPTEYAPDVEAILWDKILYNAALNPLGAILECTYGDLAANAGTCKIMDGIINEIFHVAQAHKIALTWKSPDAYREHFYQRLVPPTAKHFPSMYYDVKAGKRIEIDALNGAIVQLAAEKGIAVPVNETITSIIKTKEALSRRI
ncbi:MAG TPA: ketopantoate reductase family protein [Nitrospirota bacterium]|nr:ketopantoate reductase family protein [Nitrospirota bacterium]